jgi:hypothetical protein
MDTASAWTAHLSKPQAMTDRVYGTHASAPVDEVLDELDRVSCDMEIGFTREQLLPYAELISQGREIVWKVQSAQ